MAIEVSVIIPNYNHSCFLSQRIDSVINQSFTNAEIIILDDCSSDASRDIIDEYEKKDDRIIKIYNNTNSGSPFKQWDKGISFASGKYIWLAESDDYADEDFLANLLPYFHKYKNLGLVYSDSTHIDENNNPIEFNRWTDDLDKDRWQNDFFNNGFDECRKYQVYKNTIFNASAVVFKKEVYVKAGGVDQSMRYAADWKLWADMLLISDVYYVSKPLNFFRHHSATTRTPKNLPLKLIEYYECIDYISKKTNVPYDSLEVQLAKMFELWHMKSPFYLVKNFKVTLYEKAKQVDRDIALRIIKFLALYPFGFIKRKFSLYLSR